MSAIRSIASLAPQPVEWLNVFGPPYVERLGLDRLVSAPAWRVEFLVDGGAAVTLGPHTDAVPRVEAVRVAQHLGLLGPFV